MVANQNSLQDVSIHTVQKLTLLLYPWSQPVDTPNHRTIAWSQCLTVSYTDILTKQSHTRSFLKELWPLMGPGDFVNNTLTSRETILRLEPLTHPLVYLVCPLRSKPVSNSPLRADMTKMPISPWAAPLIMFLTNPACPGASRMV